MKCPKEQPALIVLSNHATYCSITMINNCRESIIALLSFPSHTSQPLDNTVYGSLKRVYVQHLIYR